MYTRRFKIYTTEGETFELTGSSLEEAYELAGYTSGDLENISYTNEISKASTDHPDYPYAEFACNDCGNTMYPTVKKGAGYNNSDLHTYMCQICGLTTPVCTEPDRALVAFNMFMATGNVPTSRQVTKAMKEAEENR